MQTELQENYLLKLDEKHESKAIKKQFSDALKKAALNESAKSYLLNNLELFQFLLKAARRYIGGETIEQALETRKNVQDEGFLTSLEFMGENVASIEEAEEATQEFVRIIENLKKENRATRVSLDLSHLGLFLNRDVGIENFKTLAIAIQGSLVELIISAEGLNQTGPILDTYFAFSKEFSNIGITVQAYLHRSVDDLRHIIERSQGKVRIVKGAYSGDKEKFLPRGVDLNNRYLEMVRTLFKSNRYCSIATFDIEVLNPVLSMIREYDIPSSLYEFEMLYGICSERLQELKKLGHPCRKYIVYGKEWYLYLCNRVAENPDNIFHVFVDILRG